MIEIGALIPTAESLFRRGSKIIERKPDIRTLETVREKLLGFGYDRRNPDVFDAVCEYGAMMMERIDHRGLMLKGPVGIGKSFGVEALAALFRLPVFNPEMCGAIFKTCNGNLVDMEKIIVTGNSFFERPADIIIDDLGTVDDAKHFGESAAVMADVLDMRYRAFIRHGVKTIVTTNLTDAELSTRYGLRIDDRLNEMFYFRTVSGVSLRRAN